MRVLVFNAGSSSLKVSLIDTAGELDQRASVGWGDDASRSADREAAVSHGLQEVCRGDTGQVEAVGHRVVHGGPRFTNTVVLDRRTTSELETLNGLAPLHNPVALETLATARRLLPGVPHAASFDTAFHATLPEPWQHYPLPERWSREWGVRRYGFHGLSVAWSTSRAAEMLGRPFDASRLVVAHLGSGCSVTAVERGRSAWTSMGMTPLEGLMMGTRAGSIDPGIPLALLRDERLTRAELANALEHSSGLLAVSGSTADLRELEEAAGAGDDRARLAIEMFVARAAVGIASATTALERLDALVFTGGIGEHAGAIRADIVRRLATLGLQEIAGTSVESDAVLSGPAIRPAVLRIEAREDRVIATEVARVLRTQPR